MSSEVRKGNITSLMSRISLSERQSIAKRDKEKLVQEEMTALYYRVEEILDQAPMVPGEKGDQVGSVPFSHKLTAPVSFINGDSEVQLRLRELLTEDSRYGVEIELADDHLSPRKRRLYTLQENMITTWDNRDITPKEWNPGEFMEVRALVEYMRTKLIASVELA